MTIMLITTFLSFHLSISQPLYDIVGVDCIQASSKIDDIASKLTIPEDWSNIETNHAHVPSLFVVNMQVSELVSSRS